jgi:hypothetical protein
VARASPLGLARDRRIRFFNYRCYTRDSGFHMTEDRRKIRLSQPARVATFSTPPVEFEAELVEIDAAMLTLSASRGLPLRIPVRLEAANQVWMGEVQGSTPLNHSGNSAGFRIEVEAQVLLSDVAAVDRLAERFRFDQLHGSAAPDDKSRTQSPIGKVTA